MDVEILKKFDLSINSRRMFVTDGDIQYVNNYDKLMNFAGSNLDEARGCDTDYLRPNYGMRYFNLEMMAGCGVHYIEVVNHNDPGCIDFTLVNDELTDYPFYLKGPITRGYVDALTSKIVKRFFHNLGYTSKKEFSPCSHFLHKANCDHKNNSELIIPSANSRTVEISKYLENGSVLNSVKWVAVLTGITSKLSQPQTGEIWDNSRKEFISGGEYFVRFMKFRNEAFRRVQENIKKQVSFDLIKIIEDMEL